MFLFVFHSGALLARLSLFSKQLLIVSSFYHSLKKRIAINWKNLQIKLNQTQSSSSVMTWSIRTNFPQKCGRYDLDSTKTTIIKKQKNIKLNSRKKKKKKSVKTCIWMEILQKNSALEFFPQSIDDDRKVLFSLSLHTLNECKQLIESYCIH